MPSPSWGSVTIGRARLIHHDASLVSKMLGGLPLAGFNCAGEIGPVGGKNFLHGFTASIALLVDAGPARA